MPDVDITWWVPLVAALVHFLLGAAWYTALSGPWMDAMRLTREEVEAGQGSMGAIYGTQFLATLVLAVGVAWLVEATGVDSVAGGIGVGVVLGAVTALASSGDFLYEPARGWKLFWINSGYRLVGVTLMAVVAARLG